MRRSFKAAKHAFDRLQLFDRLQRLSNTG